MKTIYQATENFFMGDGTIADLYIYPIILFACYLTALF